MMTGMTPEEAGNFYEEDEDPREVFSWFDAGPEGVTALPAAVQQPVTAEVVARVLASGLKISPGSGLRVHMPNGARHRLTGGRDSE